MKAPRIFLFALGLVAVAVMLRPPVVSAEPRRPNIIFILTDDLDTEYPNNSWIDHFPTLKSLLADQGTTFKNSFVSLSLCCPSRTSMLRGQYAHNTQIFTNSAPGGGFQKAHDEGLENATFATWLQDAGYRTILIGKYLNGYPGNLGAKYIAPGWNEWFSGEKNQYNQFNYTANDSGKIEAFGNAPEDYEQDVFRGKAVDFIQRMALDTQPFFMWMTTYSPHQPATFAPRDADAFPDAKAPRPPTFNQADVSQQPSWVQNRPLLTTAQIASLDALYQKRLKSMLAVEDTVEAIIETLGDTKQLDNTYIFFSSDNGFHLGQHRLPAGKNTEFEEDLRVPLIVRGPGIPSGRVLEHITLNIDFAPTFAELAGVIIPDFVDGRSLVPLLRDRVAPVERWRKGFLLEHGFIQTGDVGRTPADASDDVEPPDPFDLAVAQPQMPQPFQGVHTKDLVYVEYVSTGEREMYNLQDDPYEQTSIAATAKPNLVSRLASWLDALRTCAGETCRDVENRPPSPRHASRSR
jgi:N-acetylglucosamine-6-sulfatase